MVQTVYYYLDSNSETRHNNAMKLPHAEKLVSQKNIPPNIYVEPTKLKSKKNHCIKLQPLNVKVENVVPDTSERKFPHRLNPQQNKPPVACNSKKLSSKIPVLQRKAVPSLKPINDNQQGDTGLSAADRRQKFHQSRLRAAGVCPTDVSVVKKQQSFVHYDLVPCYEGYIVHKIIAPPVPAVNLKSILPPIKPVEMTAGTVQKSTQQKSKCLLGEITHFPALCNPSCSKRRKKHTSTVPHLPPILPPPAAPPPSISSSLEKDGNQVHSQCIKVLTK